MKIQCDVCTKDEASVFCKADEAALCASCDHSVHHANKLAGKHQRFSLLHPSPNHFPLCDICKERRAFLFCQQDRAILCKDCDIPIHKANKLRLNHNRFLLTGIKLSATSVLYTSSSLASFDAIADCSSQNFSAKNIPVELPVAATNTQVVPQTVEKTVEPTVAAEKGGSTSSISEYLMEMLPGWRVEDLLDPPPPSSGFSKTVDDVLPIWDADLENNLCPFPSEENMGIWVPQAPSLYPYPNMAFEGQIGFKETKGAATNNSKSSRKGRDDASFTVPEISFASKKSRNFW